MLRRRGGAVRVPRAREEAAGRPVEGGADAGTGDPLDPGVADRVRAVLTLGGVPYAELPDGVQQIRLRLLERAARGQEELRDVAAWAAVVASNLAMDWHRARRRQERLGERLAALRPEDRSEHRAADESPLLSLSVARGLDELPAPQRQVVVLRYYADLPVRDIARELDIPEGTVKSRLHAAVRALRERLHEDEVV